MIEGLKPYGAYKDSGSKWLGRVPDSWQVQSLRSLIGKCTARNRPDLPLLSVAREKGVFVRSLTDADENHNVIPDDLSNYKVARAGSLVINKMKAWQGSMGIAPCDGIVSPAYFVFDLRLANAAFGQRLFRSKPYVSHFAQASDGVRVGQWDLSIAGMREIPVLVPPPNEQATIVRFLDHADRKIDGFIRAKRKLITLLNEQKQAIIHRAVTRGLDADVPLMESVAQNVGTFPAHWKVVALKHLLRRLIDCEHKTAPHVSESEFRVLRTSAIKNGRLVWSGTYCTSRSAFDQWTARGAPEAGDVVFTREAPAGEACVVTEGARVCLGQRTVLMKPRLSLLNPEFLVHSIYFGPPRITVELASQGSTVGHFNMSDIGAMLMLVPPLEEQKAIVDHCRMAVAPLAEAILRTEREIALLQEYRIRLTTDIVTGKLDVRDAAASLPELVDTAADETTIEAATDELELEDIE